MDQQTRLSPHGKIRLVLFFSFLECDLPTESAAWALALGDVSDHVPWNIHINTSIPKGKVFIFENYWMKLPDFMSVVAHGWSVPVNVTDKAKVITAKFKNLRRVLKAWQANLSSLKTNISNVKLILALLEVSEEFRDLSLQEWNFKDILCRKLNSLLEQQRIY